MLVRSSILLLSTLLASTSFPLYASTTGIPGYSTSATGSSSCNACHTYSLTDPYNSLNLSGVTTVLAGSSNSYSITLTAPLLQDVQYGGFDISATAGSLVPVDSETAIINNELVHSNRKAVNTGLLDSTVSWNFAWQAPPVAGTVTLYACGLPVNGDGQASPHHMMSSTDGRTACTTLAIQVLQPPVADAGNNQTLTEGAGVTLDGSLSSDADGSITGYLWQQLSGTSVSLSNNGVSQPTFTAPNVPANTTDELVFKLTVTDNDGLSSTDQVSVFVQDVAVSNTPPVAVAGTDQSVNELDPVTLDASASTDDGSITSYLWQQTAGTSVSLTNPNTAITGFTAPAVTSLGDTLTFKLTVTDNLGVSSTDYINILVNDVDQPPVAKITDASGVAISAINNNGTVTLYGNFSNDPDGPITAYSWSQTAGSPIINPGPANGSSFTFTAPNDPGNSIDIRLQVTGDNGTTTNAVTATLTLADLPPAVYAGLDQVVTEGATIALHSEVSDPNNNLASVQWRQINCGSSCIMSTVDVPLPLINLDAYTSILAPPVSAQTSGQLLTFQLTAVDAAGQSSSDTVQVSVNDNGISGFPDNSTTFMSSNNQPMAIQVAPLDTANTATITQLQPVSDTSITDTTNRPLSFPYELTNIEIGLSNPGSVAITLYFPQPVPKNFDFYQYLGGEGWVNTTKPRNFDDIRYNSSIGWSEVTGEVEFSADRKSVTLYLADNGAGDQNNLNKLILTTGGVAENPPLNQQQSGATGSIHWPLLVFMLMLLGWRWRRS